MKNFLFFLILIFPVVAFGQNIRIEQIRSTGEPAGRIIVTDGGGSFEFSSNSYASDSTEIQTHLDNDNDMNPDNELIDSVLIDGVYLRIYEGGNAVGHSVDLSELLSSGSKLDSINMVGDTLKVYQGGDTTPYNVIVDFTNYWSKTEITPADTARWGASGGGTVTLTDEVTGSGEGTIPTAVADNVIDYGNVDETLKSSTTNNTLTWDISANGIITCNTTGGTVAFSNLQTNKVLKVKLITTGAITWPANAAITTGSAEITSGTYYVICDCWGSEVLVSIVETN